MFRTDEFKQCTEDMRQAIQRESNPMDADLERVLPGVHRWHQANQQAMDAMTNKVDGFIEEVRSPQKAAGIFSVL